MTTEQMNSATMPPAPPKPADLVHQLIGAAEQRGLTAKQVAHAILHFSRPPDYSELEPKQRAVAEKMFNGLSQMVVLLPDREAAQPEGGPIVLAWYWWWQGDRLASGSSSDEMQRLTDGEDIETAADRIAHVLALQPATI
ncbi:hypothetical protein [Nonomuraea sp. NPDC052265]|uniref:hypothetical protein n=1 Tax=Nonomuraea sp. NPDC052265 TaxID=3364374 RepID=UPI0037C6A21C